MWTATSRDALEHYQNYHTREQEQAICEFLGICQQCPALGSRIQKRNTSGHQDKGNQCNTFRKFAGHAGPLTATTTNRTSGPDTSSGRMGRPRLNLSRLLLMRNKWRALLYARQNGLLDEPGWEKSRLAKREKVLVQQVNQAKSTRQQR